MLIKKIVQITFSVSICFSCNALFAKNIGIGIPCDNRGYWDKVSKSPDAKKFLAKYKNSPPLMSDWVEKDYKKFFLNGDRRDGEKMMNNRSSIIAPLVFLECLEWDGKNINNINKYIYEWAAQKKWVWPAHSMESVNSGIEGLDVYSAAVMVDVLQALYLLGDKIHDPVKNKINEEIKSKILNKLVNKKINEIWWARSNSNWLFLCSLGVIYSVLVVNEEKYNHIVNALVENIVKIGFPSPYSEGFTYWEISLRSLAIINLLVKNKKAEENIFFDKIPGILNKAKFFLNVADGRYPAFGDSSLEGYVGWFFKYLWRPQIYSRDSLIYQQFLDWENSDPMSFILAEAFLPYYYNMLSDQDGKVFVDNNYGVLAIKYKDIGFFVKTNWVDGPHSHEDIGSFFMRHKNEFCLGDPGKGRYDKSYFESGVVNSWRSQINHPIPVVGEVNYSKNTKLHLDTSYLGDQNIYFFEVTNNKNWISRSLFFDTVQDGVIEIKDNLMATETLNKTHFSIPFNPGCIKRLMNNKSIFYENEIGDICVTFVSGGRYDLYLEKASEKLYFARFSLENATKLEYTVVLEKCSDK